MTKKFLIVVIVLVNYSYTALAQPSLVTQYKEPIGPPAPIPTLCDIRGKKDAGELFQTVYLCAMGFTGVAALLTLTVGGVWYLMAGGNEKMIGQAKTWITNAVFGLVLALVSWLILFTINPELVKKATLVLPEITLIKAPEKKFFSEAVLENLPKKFDNLGQLCAALGGKMEQPHRLAKKRCFVGKFGFSNDLAGLRGLCRKIQGEMEGDACVRK